MAEIKVDQATLGSVNGKVVVLAGMRTALITMIALTEPFLYRDL
jgi:hypothetical protein